MKMQAVQNEPVLWMEPATHNSWRCQSLTKIIHYQNFNVNGGDALLH